MVEVTPKNTTVKRHHRRKTTLGGVTPFTYLKGYSALHLLDTRLKFFMLCLVSLSIVWAQPLACALYLMILFFFFQSTGLSLMQSLKSIKYFLLLLLLLFITRVLAWEGDTLYSLFGITVSREGINDGFIVVFRFFLVMITGLLFSVTTSPACVKSAVQWFLKPVPFIPEKRVAVMISLSLRFIPVIYKQAKEISDARKARCGDLRKNPVKRIIQLTGPLLKKTFLTADDLVLAMESRCYSEDRTDPILTPSGREPLFFCGTLALCSGLVFI